MGGTIVGCSTEAIPLTCLMSPKQVLVITALMGYID